MIRYVIALLLINNHYRSLGHPVQQNASVPIADALRLLADNCPNPFLSSIIKHSIEHCNVSVPPYNENQIDCLLYYDINIQLCNIHNSLKFDLKENFTLQINQSQEVNSLCTAAKSWPFLQLTKFPLYKALVEKLFNNPTTCLKVCGVDDLMSQDSNYYCKYYKWGAELIQAATVVQTVHQDVVVGPVSQNLPIKLDNKPSIPTTASDVVLTESGPSAIIKESTDTTQTKLDETAQSKDVKPVKDEKQVVQITPANSLSSTLENEGKHPKVDVVPKEINQVVLGITPSIRSEIEKPPVEEEPPKKDDVENKDQLILNPSSDQKDTVVDNPKVKSPVVDIDEDQENDFGNDLDPEDETLAENQESIDGNDPDLESDGKLNHEKNSANVRVMNSPITSFNGDPSQRDFYSNNIQDGFSADDDHFFPFFLTAIILVVLLYVLYHNKGKFSKVLLGLIVEGRQSNRRRNSRGHAYRRLDTLEQAMSSNTSAPPSKIIY